MSVLTMPATALPVARSADASPSAPRKRLLDQDAPARISPDRAVFVRPVALGLLAVFVIAGTTSGFAFTALISTRTGVGFLGLSAFIVVEFAMVILTFAAAIYRERGANPLLILGAWGFAIFLTLVSMAVNLLHAVEMTRALTATGIIGQATAWLTSGVLTLPPLLALICAHAFILIFVRHAEGTRKQRLRAAAKKEAAAVEIVAEPVSAAAVAPRAAVPAAPRAISTPRPNANRADILARMTDLYREGMNDSQIKRVLADEFGVKRTIFEAHREAAKAAAGVA